MQFCRLGTTGLPVSRIGLGCNNFGDRLGREASFLVIERALERGITFFDTADIYGSRGGSETILGEALGTRRKDIVLATKFGGAMSEVPTRRGASRRNAIDAVEDSLRRLRTDWIDLLQLHRPDPATPVEETLRALDDLIRAGKIRYIGCSNMAPWQVVEAHWVARSNGLARFATAQDEYSLLRREPERELVPALAACQMGLIPYYPLASGMLTGKYQSLTDLPADTRLASGRLREPDRFLNARNLSIVQELGEFCRQRGCTLVQLAVSWLAAQPQVCAIIIGASRPDQIDENIGAVGLSLDADDLREIDRITLPSAPR